MAKQTRTLNKEELTVFLSETRQVKSFQGSSIRIRDADNTYWSVYMYSVMALTKSEVTAIGIEVKSAKK